MPGTYVDALLKIKHVIDALQAIDRATLTETEQDTVQDCLQQAYERATFFLNKARLTPMSEKHFFTFEDFGTESLSDAAPTTRHPDPFLKEPLPLKKGSRSRLSVGPTAPDVRLLPEVP